MTDPLRNPVRRVAPSLPARPPLSADYEYRMFTMPRGTTGLQARRQLTEHAEYGHWELARVQVMVGGSRRIWMRRRIIRVERTG